MKNNKRWPIPNLKTTTDISGIDDTIEAGENFENQEVNSEAAYFEEAYLEAAKSKVNLLQLIYNNNVHG